MFISFENVSMSMHGDATTLINMFGHKEKGKPDIQGQFVVNGIEKSYKYKKANVTLRDLGHFSSSNRQFFVFSVILSELWQLGGNKIYVFNKFLPLGAVSTNHSSKIKYLSAIVPIDYKGRDVDFIVDEVYTLMVEFFE